MKEKNDSGRNKVIRIIFWAISVIIGLIVGYTVSKGELLSNLYNIPIYTSLLIFILAYILSITIHELGHFFSFIKNGINMRALFIIIFMFIKKEGKWKACINLNNVTALGGIAIPEVTPVKNEQEFKKLQRGYSKAIIAGPITSIISCLLLLLVILPILFLTDTYLNSLLFVFIVSYTAVTILITLASFIKNEVAVGDFPAYTLSKNDDFFIAMQLYQYVLFSSEPIRNRKENIYLKKLLLDILEQKLKNKDTHVYTINMIDVFLVEHLACKSQLPEVVKDYINFLLRNSSKLLNKNRSEIIRIFIFHTIRLLHQEESTKIDALNLYSKIMNSLEKITPVDTYYIKQTEHVLGITDNSQFLKDKNNIKTSSAYELWRNFEGYYVDEIALNK